MYYIIEKTTSNQLVRIKEIETAQGVINYLRPVMDKPNELSNIRIIEGDEYEVITKLKLKDK